MPLTSEQKKNLRAEHGSSETDTGSVLVQVAQLTERITRLTEHMKENKKDASCKRGLIMLVGQRRRFMKYYRKKHGEAQYQELLKRFNLRK